MPNLRFHPALAAAACLALPPVAAAAQTAPAEVPAPAPAPAPTPAPSATAAFDEIWSTARLYRNEESDGLNELRIIGRLHLDNYVVDADQGNDSDLTVRRARLGARARLLHNLDVQVETELNLEGGPLYDRLTDAYVAWKFSDAARLTVGKHSAKFTLDGATSSNELLTIERSNVANNFWFTEEYMSGASLSGRSGAWSYTGGVFSSGRRDSDFGHFDGGAFVLASLGRDFGEDLGMEKALLRIDYVHNEADVNNTSTRSFGDVVALVGVLEQEDWGLSADLVHGNGYLGQSNAWGSTVTPWVDVTDNLQAVARFTWLDSARNNGLRLGRYDNAVTGGRGDRYTEVYGGLNYYIYGNKLKLQTGLAYGHMRDRANDGGAYDGITWTTALRFSF
ncbi:porin [Alteraurantiacibacter buctensis]|uniref:Porin n=1 Tax=Alteraurantiacibacter buctensis TaxID=1503981 RepID=A0A844YT28_9SPHN|nr:porin [Alteraurantiacibacter buctensis]MXO70252.1 hypothetical protein [Alteraurantiacibacter buctensis]